MAFPTGKCAVAILVSEAPNRALSEWTDDPPGARRRFPQGRVCGEVVAAIWAY